MAEGDPYLEHVQGDVIRSCASPFSTCAFVPDSRADIKKTRCNNIFHYNPHNTYISLTCITQSSPLFSARYSRPCPPLSCVSYHNTAKLRAAHHLQQAQRNIKTTCKSLSESYTPFPPKTNLAHSPLSVPTQSPILTGPHPFSSPANTHGHPRTLISQSLMPSYEQGSAPSLTSPNAGSS